MSCTSASLALLNGLHQTQHKSTAKLEHATRHHVQTLLTAPAAFEVYKLVSRRNTLRHHTGNYETTYGNCEQHT